MKVMSIKGIRTIFSFLFLYSFCFFLSSDELFYASLEVSLFSCSPVNRFIDNMTAYKSIYSILWQYWGMPETNDRDLIDV